MRRLLAALTLLVAFALPAAAQEDAYDPVPSRCVAIAQALPKATFASFQVPGHDPGRASGQPPVQTAQTFVDGDVTITYAGHSTYIIETPGGVRIATDYSGVYGHTPLPRVVTMNKAHRTHYTDSPDPGIEYVLRGWNPAGGPARHAVVVDDVYIRNVPTDIRDWGGGVEIGGNSIFIFEVAGLCIGHLGHLHHPLTDAHYGAIGRLDIVMVPVDGGMTLSLGRMTEITQRLYSSVVLPMHRHATPMSAFTGPMSKDFAIEYRDERSLKVSLRSLPSRPTIVVLQGV